MDDSKDNTSVCQHKSHASKTQSLFIYGDIDISDPDTCNNDNTNTNEEQCEDHDFHNVSFSFSAHEAVASDTRKHAESSMVKVTIVTSCQWLAATRPRLGLEKENCGL